MENFLNFVPPDGDVAEFNLHAELGPSFKKIKLGIYRNSSACCHVMQTSKGIRLHGITHDWPKLSELVAKIISAASMTPNVIYTEDTPPEDILLGWTEALLALTKPLSKKLDHEHSTFKHCTYIGLGTEIHYHSNDSDSSIHTLVFVFNLEKSSGQNNSIP